MINLLPPDAKEEIIYGRRNRKILHALAVLVLVHIAILGITVFGHVYITSAQDSYKVAAAEASKRIKDQKLEETQKQLETLSNNFKTVVQIISKQVLFSKLFEKVGSIIPNGAILTNLTLTNNDTALDLTIAATNRENANQAYVNISDPNNGLFEKADLIGISCVQRTSTTAANTASETTSKYPCQATVRVLFKTNSSFLFLNSVKESGANN